MKKIKLIAAIILAFVLANQVKAQPNPGPGNQGSNISITSDGPTVPFDGGMSLILLASGVGYASKKMKAVLAK